MHFKALQAGLLLGFLVGLTPSCSQPPCNPTTCAGCCDAVTGICVNPPSPIACGTGGGACRACGTNESCAGGVCVSGNVSGSVDGGTDGGQACDGGNCNGLSALLGKACAQDSECSALGTGAQCRKQTTTDAGTYTGGYCTRVCSDDSGCPAEGWCINLSSYDETSRLCMPKCSQKGKAPGDCRQGYACYDIGETQGICWITPLPQVDAGPPSDKVGNPCTSNSECQNPPSQGGFCVPETTDGGLSTGFKDGFCSADCSTRTGICSADGGAICLRFTSNAEVSYNCQRVCAAPGGGQSDCRNGYVCQGYIVALGDGGSTPSTNGYCRPHCGNTDAGCNGGQTCTDAGYCE